MGWCPAPRALSWVGFFPPLRFFSNFRARGPCVKINDLSAPSGRFVARVSATVTTTDRRPGRGDFFLLSTPFSLRFLPYPVRAARARQEPPLPRRLSPSMLIPSRALHREPIPPRSLVRPRPPLRRLATRHVRLPCRLRAALPLGRADEQPLPLPLSRLLLNMASGPTGALVHPHGVLTPRRESHGRDRLWPSTALLLPPHVSRRCPSRPAAATRSL